MEEKKGGSKSNVAIIHPDLGIVTVYGAFLPRHIFYRLHALCAYIRCLSVALCMLFMWPSFDVILADQVSVVIPLLRLKKATKHATVLRRIYRNPRLHRRIDNLNGI
ncbi:hypothetical protein EV1_030650 [Malus domestica]